MAQITRLLGGMTAMLLSSSLYAVDVPEVEEDVTKYDWKMCVNQRTDFCISTVCSSSESRDCPENCERLAKEDCKEKYLD